ncbi:MAG: 3-oxoacyl-[acyl-carrier-protein] reductase [Planctomycetaceae bacterium]|jgi:3-oxoacyl-[acyl-carrier protein] reductase|nr:3-oxoacyl-[acyl-carrier-protein] reductase [Planctomycetaceae bacterium]
MINVDLKDRIAIVTGATRGIGLGIAKALVSSGVKTSIVGTNQERLDSAIESLSQLGTNVDGYICNVSMTDAVENTVNSVLSKHGQIDILVNCAGITRDVPLGAMKDEQWDDVIAINLRGPFLFTRACSKPMRRARKGRIVNITSIVGMMGNKGQANYSASKAGLIGFTRTAAKELAGKNITVNAIAPGFIDTDMTAVLPEVIKNEMLSRTPLARFGQVDDVANAVLFFVSDEASFITGQILTVDGGLTR